MYSITKNGEKTQYGVNEYLVDTLQDLNLIEYAAPGSKAYVLSELKTYIKTNEGDWEEYASAISSGGGSGDDSASEAVRFTEQSLNNTQKAQARKNIGAVGTNGIAEGAEIFNDYINNSASGTYAHAEGKSTAASAHYSHTEGYNTIASKEAAHAEGNNTTASGNHSHTEGTKTSAIGTGAHAEGGSTNKAAGITSTTPVSTIKSKWDSTKFSLAFGAASHVEGTNNLALAINAHAEGSSTIASGYCSHAEGADTTASGNNSHAEGNNTIASGMSSHAEGSGAVADGMGSHAEGYLTQASGAYSHAEGSCNIKDTAKEYAHIVGNGISDKKRSNAHTLDWDGNAWFAGDVYVGSSSGTNKDEGSIKLATEDFAKTRLIDNDLITKEIKLQDMVFDIVLNNPLGENIYQTVIYSNVITDHSIKTASIKFYSLPEGIDQNDTAMGIYTEELYVQAIDAMNGCLICYKNINDDALWHYSSNINNVPIGNSDCIVGMIYSNKPIEGAQAEALKNRYKDASLVYSYYDSSTAEVPEHEIDLYSNTEVHYKSPVEALKINSFVSSYPGYSESWTISFIAGDEDPIIDLPDNVKWAIAEPVFEANKYYLLTFVPVGEYYLGIWTVMNVV